MKKRHGGFVSRVPHVIPLLDPAGADTELVLLAESGRYRLHRGHQCDCDCRA